MSAVAAFQAQTEQLATQSQAEAVRAYLLLAEGRIDQAAAAAMIAGAVNRATAAAVALADAYVSNAIEEQTGQPTPSVGVLPSDDSDRLAKAALTILSEPPKTKLTQADVRRIITDLGLDPSDWDVAAMTRLTNRSIRHAVLELTQDVDDFTPADHVAAHNEHGRLMGVDFLEILAEQAARNEEAADKLWSELQTNQYDELPAVWEHAPADAQMRLDRLARSEVFEAAQQGALDAMQQQSQVEGWIRQMDADPCQLCVWWWREGRIWPKAHPMPRHKGCNCQPRIVLAEHIQSTGYTRRLERNQNE